MQSQKRKFSEIRYLTDPHMLAQWCAFERLRESPFGAQFGSSQCYGTGEEDAVDCKFISALWFRFAENRDKIGPPHVQVRCHLILKHHLTHLTFQLSLQGWISTLHWNGQQFRAGDFEGSALGKQKVAAVCKEVLEAHQVSLGALFNDHIQKALAECRPRILEKRKSEKPKWTNIVPICSAKLMHLRQVVLGERKIDFY